jgi:hypothetical protein
MVRRLAIGTLAAAALLGGSVLTVSVERAQAQALSCSSWLGSNGACSESYFNKDSGPDRNTVMVPDRVPQTTASASQSAGQADSQAGPQPEQQEVAHE